MPEPSSYDLAVPFRRGIVLHCHFHSQCVSVCLDMYVCRYIDQFISPVTVMNGEKFSGANEVLVKALTGIYFCSFFF